MVRWWCCPKFFCSVGEEGERAGRVGGPCGWVGGWPLSPRVLERWPGVAGQGQGGTMSTHRNIPK